VTDDTKQKNSRRPGRMTIALVATLIILATFAGYYVHSRGSVSTDDAYVDGRVHTVTPRVTGYVTQVLVEDNQLVEPGQPLAQLDTTEFEVAVAKARATLAEEEATLASLELGVPLELSQTEYRVGGAQADLEGAMKRLEKLAQQEAASGQDLQRLRAELRQAELDLKRIEELARTDAVSQSSLDQARTAFESAQAQTRSALATLEAVRKEKNAVQLEQDGLRANVSLAATGSETAVIKKRQVEAQKAVVDMQKAALRQAELDLEHTTLRAPALGHVTQKSVETGRMVSRGQTLMAVVPLRAEELWITANFKETQLTHVKPGQRVKIKVDTYPGHELTGTVESIMAGTGSVFSLFPPENASGNFVKVVQRIPVRIKLDAPGPEASSEEAPQLRIGMSVIPTIYVND